MDPTNLKEFATYVPLRLTPTERSLLTVLESTLSVSEYTDVVDVATNRYGSIGSALRGVGGSYGPGGGGNSHNNSTNATKIKRILNGILEACCVATGLGVAGRMDGVRDVVRALEESGVGKRGLGDRRGRREGSSIGRRKKGEKKRLMMGIGRKGGDGGDGSGILGGEDDGASGHLTKKRAKQAEKARKKKEKLLRKIQQRGKKQRNCGAGGIHKHGTDDDDDDDGTDNGTDETISAVEGITIDSSDNIVSSTSSSDHDPPPNPADEEEEEDHSTPPTPTRSSSKNNNNNNNNINASSMDLPPQYHDIHSIASLPPAQNELFLRRLFEIGRRNKILNPSRMRDTYGKLMHLLQDAQTPSVARSLGFGLYEEIAMVRPFLEERGWGDILDDERLGMATAFVEVRDWESGERLDRGVLEERVEKKKRAMEELLEEYVSVEEEGDEEREEDDANGGGSNSDNNDGDVEARRNELRRCIDSIADAVATVESNVAPVRRTLRLLETYFSPTGPPLDGLSLAIHAGVSSSPESTSGVEGGGRMNGGGGGSSGGRYGFSAFGGGGIGVGGKDRSGPTLNHQHPVQYAFVWQSLKLWEEVMRNMHRLWVCTDDDLLSTTTSYQLLNTGQGLNRVQPCPRVGRVMRNLLHKTQKAAASPWVGLSVIHLGDRDVPNALVFVDKYTQIPRFLSPIVDVVDGVSETCASDPRIARYVKEVFGSERELKTTVLRDYFRHGFDGSGDDGGSCIDGRLTSSWNWTSRVAKKRYYHFFMLSGFQGFDGEFK